MLSHLFEIVFGHTQNRGCGPAAALCGATSAARVYLVFLNSSNACTSLAFASSASDADPGFFPHVCGLVVPGCMREQSRRLV
jgi:hypothetical protein